MKKGDVVISLNGRDGGKRFLIVETQGYYSLLADGKGRRLEKPKRKKNKHVKLEGIADDRIAEKLKSGEKVTNNEIRRALAQFDADNGENSSKEEQGGM
jgi:ribosomal protein L14E/L6E/L27E